jgi:hypothetical protein
MTHEAGREPARDPQDLERLLVSRESRRRRNGMAALYEAHAVGDCGNGQLLSMAPSVLHWQRRAVGQVAEVLFSNVLELGENAPEGKMN